MARLRIMALVSFTLAGCGGPVPQPAVPVAPAPQVIGRGTAADPVQLCHMNGGEGRTDYDFVASYRCPDGSVPLGGDPARAAGARRGNVGPGPDGHVVDLYDVPCAGGAIELYVDAYHCGPSVDVEIDPENLTREQLRRMATMIRALHEDPAGERALELRRQLIAWVMETRQVTVEICPALAALVPEDGGPMYTAELMLSLAAAVIEDGNDPADGSAVYLNAIYGVLVFYEAVVRLGGPRHPGFDALHRMAGDHTLEAQVEQMAAGCTFSRMGVHFAR